MFGLKTIISATLLSLVTFTQAAPGGELLEKRLSRTGRATYFYVGQGACGWWNKDSDWIVALNSDIYEMNGGSNCGQNVAIHYNGKTAIAQVADECPTCDGNSLDLSPSLFSYLTDGNMDLGEIQMTWNFKHKN